MHSCQLVKICILLGKIAVWSENYMEHVWTRCRVHIATCGCKYSFYGTSKSEITIFGTLIGTNYPEVQLQERIFYL